MCTRYIFNIKHDSLSFTYYNYLRLKLNKNNMTLLYLQILSNKTRPQTVPYKEYNTLFHLRLRST